MYKTVLQTLRRLVQKTTQWREKRLWKRDAYKILQALKEHLFQETQIPLEEFRGGFKPIEHLRSELHIHDPKFGVARHYLIEQGYVKYDSGNLRITGQGMDFLEPWHWKHRSILVTAIFTGVLTLSISWSSVWWAQHLQAHSRYKEERWDKVNQMTGLLEKLMILQSQYAGANVNEQFYQVLLVVRQDRATYEIWTQLVARNNDLLIALLDVRQQMQIVLKHIEKLYSEDEEIQELVGKISRFTLPSQLGVPFTEVGHPLGIYFLRPDTPSLKFFEKSAEYHEKVLKEWMPKVTKELEEKLETPGKRLITLMQLRAMAD